MVRLHEVVFCDGCNEVLNDNYDIEEKEVYFLDLPGTDRMIFCSEHCRDEYIKELMAEGYITPSGSIYED